MVTVRKCPICDSTEDPIDVDGLIKKCDNCGNYYNEDNYPEYELEKEVDE